MIQAVFFDYDGVLDKRTLKEGWRLLLKNIYNPSSIIGFDEFSRQMQRLYGDLKRSYNKGILSSRLFYEELLSKGFTVYDLENLEKFMLGFELNAELWKHLETLKDRYFLGMLAEIPTDKFSLIQNTIDLEKFFKSINVSCQTHMDKSDEAFYRLMVKESGFRPEEILFVDDNPFNIEIAKEMGYQTVHYQWGNNTFMDILLT